MSSALAPCSPVARAGGVAHEHAGARQQGRVPVADERVEHVVGAAGHVRAARLVVVTP